MYRNQQSILQEEAFSLFPTCSVIGTIRCSGKVFAHCIRCGRAICLAHTQSLASQECLLDNPTCVVCLYPERYPRDPAVGKWRPYRGYPKKGKQVLNPLLRIRLHRVGVEFRLLSPVAKERNSPSLLLGRRARETLILIVSHERA